MNQTQNNNQTVTVASGRFTYSQTDLLGKGSTGNVYKAYDSHQNRFVAIKVVHPGKMNSVQKSLIQNQKKALSILNHTNIIKLIHIEQQPTTTYIISELYQSDTLEEHIKKKGVFNEQEGMQFFRKIIDGYSAIVDKNIIHRDLKPTNILLNQRNQPVIIDFGYCQIIVAGKNLTVFNVGSPSYMSPEAYTKTIYSQKSDIWSLGAIFYKILTNKTLDNNLSIKDYFDNLKSAEHPPIDFQKFSQVTRQILKGALTVKPQKRITTHRIKYLLDKEILGKKFSWKKLRRDGFQMKELRTSLQNSASIKNLEYLVKEIDLSKLKHQEDSKLIPKKPIFNNVLSTNPMSCLTAMTPRSAKNQTVQFSRHVSTKQFQGFSQQRSIQTKTPTNKSREPPPQSLNITSSVSRIQYIPICEYKKSVSKINFINTSIQEIKNQKLQTEEVLSKKKQFQENSIKRSESNTAVAKKVGTSFVRTNAGKQSVSSFTLGNQPKVSAQTSFITQNLRKPQSTTINNMSYTSVNFTSHTPRTSQNQKMKTHVSFNQISAQIDFKPQKKQVEGKINNKLQTLPWMIKNNIKQKNGYIQQPPKPPKPYYVLQKPSYLEQKPYNSQKNDAYQKVSFHNFFLPPRASQKNLTPFISVEKPTNFSPYNNLNYESIINNYRKIH